MNCKSRPFIPPRVTHLTTTTAVAWNGWSWSKTTVAALLPGSFLYDARSCSHLIYVVLQTLCIFMFAFDCADTHIGWSEAVPSTHTRCARVCRAKLTSIWNNFPQICNVFGWSQKSSVQVFTLNVQFRFDDALVFFKCCTICILYGVPRLMIIAINTK